MPSFKIYLVPEIYWNEESSVPEEGHALAKLIKKILIYRRRIDKNSNLQPERKRYSSELTRLEGELFQYVSKYGTRFANQQELIRHLYEGKIQCVDFSSEKKYFELIMLAQMDRISESSNCKSYDYQLAVVNSGGSPCLGSSVFPPWTLKAHLNELNNFSNSVAFDKNKELSEALENRKKFINAAMYLGVGLIEVIDCLDNASKENGNSSLPLKRVQIHDFQKPNSNNIFESLSKSGRQRMIDRLTAEIQVALTTDGKVNMSDPTHEIDTWVLRRFLYKTPEQSEGKIRIIYADGSEAKPFPLRLLDSPSADFLSNFENDCVKIPTALMSMRHLELDLTVDWAWYRNQEVSQNRSLAETDDFCFHYSQRQLNDLREVYKGKRVRIEMYHTGFEPAVIGFYRAVALELKNNYGWLQIEPLYYRGDHFEKDLIWG